MRFDTAFEKYVKNIENGYPNPYKLISINAPSLTPTAPGDGIPETVAYTTDCIDVISKILCSVNPNERYTQYEIL